LDTRRDDIEEEEIYRIDENGELMYGERVDRVEGDEDVEDMDDGDVVRGDGVEREWSYTDGGKQASGPSRSVSRRLSFGAETVLPKKTSAYQDIMKLFGKDVSYKPKT